MRFVSLVRLSVCELHAPQFRRALCPYLVARVGGAALRRSRRDGSKRAARASGGSRHGAAEGESQALDIPSNETTGSCRSPPGCKGACRHNTYYPHRDSSASRALADPLRALCTAISTFIRCEVVPALAAKAARSPPVASPFVGGIVQPAVTVSTPVQSQQSAPARSHVAVAILNPGRSGFLHLGSDLLLEWRLEAVAHTEEEEAEGTNPAVATPGAFIQTDAAVVKGGRP